MAYKWYAGVPHCHTIASDGKLTLEKVIQIAKRNKLDFLIMTDHNVNCNEFPEVDGLILIYGAEYTKHGGHSNFWVSKTLLTITAAKPTKNGLP